MARAGFGDLSEDVLVSFEKALTAGAWAAVDASEWAPRKGGKEKPLEDAPVLVFHKVMLLGAVQALVSALASGNDALAVVDDAWDEEQRTLDLEVALKERKKQPAAVREAAARVRAALLDQGTAQINYDPDKEVRFGLKQVAVAKAQPIAADVEALGLGHVIAAIDKATAALAKASGYGADDKAPRARSQRVLVAQRRAAAACNAAWETLSALVERAPEATARRAELAALAGTLEALLAQREVAKPAPATGENNPPTK